MKSSSKPTTKKEKPLVSAKAIAEVTASAKAAVKTKKKKPEEVGPDGKPLPKKDSTPEMLSKAKAKVKDMKKELREDMDDVDSKLEGFADNTWIHTYELMFRRLKKIMRTMEARVMNSSHAQDIYALMALYNQMREVIADIRSMIDLSQNTQRIIDNILYPMVRDISNNYVDAIFMIKKTLRANVDSERYIELKSALDDCLKEHAKYIQSSYEKSSENLAKLLEEQ